jgi:hypothetical protein
VATCSRSLDLDHVQKRIWRIGGVANSGVRLPANACGIQDALGITAAICASSGDARLSPSSALRQASDTSVATRVAILAKIIAPPPVSYADIRTDR